MIRRVWGGCAGLRLLKGTLANVCIRAASVDTLLDISDVLHFLPLGYNDMSNQFRFLTCVRLPCFGSVALLAAFVHHVNDRVHICLALIKTMRHWFQCQG